MSPRIAGLLVAALVGTASVSPGQERTELWRVPIDGDLRTWVAACDDRPDCPIFLLVANRHGELNEFPEGAQVEEPPANQERSWSILRWSPDRGGTAAPLLGPLVFEREPEIRRVVQANGPILTLIGDRQLWQWPIADLVKAESLELGPARVIDPGELNGRLRATNEPDVFVSVSVGELAILGADQGRRVFTTPVDVDRGSAALTLRSPPATPLPDGRWIIGPQPHGDRRLRTLIIDPSRPPTAPDSQADESITPNPEEIWSLLPSPERVVEARYEVFDDRILLLVTTLRADKMGIIEKKKLRIFEMVGDRTRTGRPPIFEVLTSSRMWQNLGIHLVDVDQDGHRDLALLQPEGMDGDKLVIDIHLDKGRGDFDPKSLRTILPNVAEGTPQFYGSDWNGDGAPDLIAFEAGQIRLYPGVRQPTRKKVMERESKELLKTGSEWNVRDVRASGQRLVSRLSGNGSALLVVFVAP